MPVAVRPAAHALCCVTPCSTARPWQANKWISFSGQHNANTARRVPPSLSGAAAETATNSPQRSTKSIGAHLRSAARLGLFQHAPQTRSITEGFKGLGPQAEPPMKRLRVSVTVSPELGTCGSSAPVLHDSLAAGETEPRRCAPSRRAMDRAGVPLDTVGGAPPTSDTMPADRRPAAIVIWRGPAWRSEAHCAGAHLASAAQHAHPTAQAAKSPAAAAESYTW